MTDKTDKEQSQDKPWQFAPGESGNPSGRPRGSRNKATLAVLALMENEAEEITRKAIEAAKAGDMAAIKLILERLLPPRKDAPVSFTLPEIRNAENIPSAMTAVIDSVSSGDLTPQEGAAISGLLEQLRRSYETAQMAAKLETLTTILSARK